MCDGSFHKISSDDLTFVAKTMANELVSSWCQSSWDDSYVSIYVSQGVIFPAQVLCSHKYPCIHTSKHFSRSFFVVQVSAPYNKILSTEVRKNASLVSLEILDFHIRCSLFMTPLGFIALPPKKKIFRSHLNLGHPWYQSSRSPLNLPGSTFSYFGPPYQYLCRTP